MKIGKISELSRKNWAAVLEIVLLMQGRCGKPLIEDKWKEMLGIGRMP